MMNTTRYSVPIAALLATFSTCCSAAEIVWTRMTGQTPVEASPLVRKFTSEQNEILILNRGGQLLLWNAAGKAIGSGQDGLVAQLPIGKWTTTPTLIDNSTSVKLIVTSVEGRAVGLDAKFQPTWAHQLAGGTEWGRAMPAVLKTATGPQFVLSDHSGTATCLNANGSVAWTKKLSQSEAANAPPQTFSNRNDVDSVLIPIGSTLYCCNATGEIEWQQNLGKLIATRPEVLSRPEGQLIVCGIEGGDLVALNGSGENLWRCATADTFNNWTTFLPRRNAEPLILFAGLWGNLHAINVKGQPEWTHLFRTKTRAAPLVLDTNGDGRNEVFVPTFHQHVYAFDDEGKLIDDVRLSGIMPAALAPIIDPKSGRADLVVANNTLLGYRLRPGQPKSPYGETPAAQDISLEWPPANASSVHQALVVRNPRGALVNVQVTLSASSGPRQIRETLTTRSQFEMPLPATVGTSKQTLRATVWDASGRVLKESTWTPTADRPPVPEPPPNRLLAWPVRPYDTFTESKLTPTAAASSSVENRTITVDSLYLDEADQGAFMIASTCSEPIRARVLLPCPKRAEGTEFAGSITLRQVIPVGSFNGEQVGDPLPALGNAGLVTIPVNRAVKIWISVDAHGAKPGSYQGRVRVVPLQASVETIEIPFVLEVLDLHLPREMPLTLCTWDYVPNHWFPTRSKEVLDDMSRHGVNVFPRTTIPAARVTADGKLNIDWTTLDAELDRLKGRGKILFQLNHPPIESATKPSNDQKRLRELEYIRAFRDHLAQHGRNYSDYAFYLLDEPGLDYGPNIAILLDIGHLIRDADPKLLTYTDPVPGLSWQDFERIEPLVDVWAPNMRLVSGLLSGDPRIERIRKAKTVWSYECVAQVKSLSPLRYNRANAWRAKYFGLSGIGFWTHSTTDVDQWFTGTSVNSEYALVYPGELPVPSVRWEAVRDGLEDVAAIDLLEQLIARHRKNGTKPELVQQAESALRIAQRDIMELSDEAFVESRDYLQKGDRVIDHSATDVDTFQRHRKKIAKLTHALAAGEGPADSE